MYSAPASSAVNDKLYRRLLWLTLLRIVLVTILLAASTLVMWRTDTKTLGQMEQALYAIIIAAYGASLAYLLVLRSSSFLRQRLAYVQIVGDVLIASCLVYLTGGAESIVVFMYPLTVVSAAVLLYRKGAVLAAVLSAVGLVVIALGLYSGRIPPPSGTFVRSAVPLPRLAFLLFAHASAIFLTAALASYLAEQLRSTRERLSLREHDYLALENLHESIVRSIASGIITVDRFGRITFLNAAAENIFGLNLLHVRGEPMERLLPQLAGHLRSTPAQRLEVNHQVREGLPRRLGCTVAPLFDRDNKNQGHVVAVEDLTSIRAMEETVKRAERLAAVGAMAAGLAHELRNPLASMSGSIQLLSSNKGFSEDEQKLMSIVLREADRLNGLVTDFLLFARPTPTQLNPLDFRNVATSTATLFGNDPARQAIKIKLDLAQELPVVGDAGQLGQVLWNLLVNAAEAMPHGGAIDVVGQRDQDDVELQVRDTGPGIAAEDLPHLFEPFYTTKARGTGLGLAIVYSIVQGHGGWLLVQSEEGRGSTFSVRLPLYRSAA